MKHLLKALPITLLALLPLAPAALADQAAADLPPEVDPGQKVVKLGYPATLEKLSGWTKYDRGKVYMLPVKAGDHLRITFSSKNPYAFMAIFDLSSNEDESFFGTDENGPTADVTVRKPTTWLIKPYYSRVTRRRGLGAPYTITIDPHPATAPLPPEQKPQERSPDLFPKRVSPQAPTTQIQR